MALYLHLLYTLVSMVYTLRMILSIITSIITLKQRRKFQQALAARFQQSSVRLKRWLDNDKTPVVAIMMRTMMMMSVGVPVVQLGKVWISPLHYKLIGTCKWNAWFSENSIFYAVSTCAPPHGKNLAACDWKSGILFHTNQLLLTRSGSLYMWLQERVLLISQIWPLHHHPTDLWLHHSCIQHHRIACK